MDTVGSRPCPVQTDWDRVHGAQLLGNALEDILTDVCTLIPTAGTINLTVAGTLGVSGVTTLSGNLATTANVTFTLGATEAFTLTCTDISAPLVMTNTMSTAGKTGCRALFHVVSNVILGGWANALKANMEFGAAGRVTGLGSCVATDLTLGAACGAAGAYACYEANIIANTGAGYGIATAFFALNTDGTAAATTDDTAVLFRMGAGLSEASGGFCDSDITTHSKVGGIRFKLNDGTVRYLAVVSD